MYFLYYNQPHVDSDQAVCVKYTLESLNVYIYPHTC